MTMLMGGKETPTTQEHPSHTAIPPGCPYGPEGCPKVDELKTELASIRKENNVIWKELNKIDEMVSANKEALSSLKWIVFVLICGATGVNLII